MGKQINCFAKIIQLENIMTDYEILLEMLNKALEQQKEIRERLDLREEDLEDLRFLAQNYRKVHDALLDLTPVIVELSQQVKSKKLKNFAEKLLKL